MENSDLYGADGIYHARRILVISTSPFHYIYLDEFKELEDMRKYPEGENCSEKSMEEIEISMQFRDSSPDSENSNRNEETVVAVIENHENFSSEATQKNGLFSKDDNYTKDKLKSYVEENFDSILGIDNPNFQDDENCQFNDTVVNQERLTPENDDKCSCEWAEKISIGFSILTHAVNFANIIRLPRIVHFNGGGAFLLIYVIVSIIFGIPLVFLEISLGQFSRQGPIKLWRALNLFRGIGYIEIINSFLIGIYYSTYLAPAATIYIWMTKSENTSLKCEHINHKNESLAESVENCPQIDFLNSPLDDGFWYGMEAAFLLFLWLLIFVCILAKTKSCERSVYVSVPLTVGILVAILAKTGTGQYEENYEIINFQWRELFHFETWYASFIQMIFSLQIGFGVLTTTAGEFFPKTDAIWSAVTIVICNLLFGISFVVFTSLWSKYSETEFSSDIPDLFVLTAIYGTSLRSEKFSIFWNLLIYLLIILAGFSSIIIFTYTIEAALSLEIKNKLPKWQITLPVCFLSFLITLLIMVPENLSVAHVLDHYVIGRIALLVIILKTIGFVCIYGSKNIYVDLEFVIGKKLSIYWKIIWSVTPILLIIFEITSVPIVSLNNNDEVWMYSLGWSLYLMSWVIIIACACYQIYVQVDYNLKQKFLSSLKASRNWGPTDPIYRHCWLQWKNKYDFEGVNDFSLKRRSTRKFTHSIRKATDENNSSK